MAGLIPVEAETSNFGVAPPAAATVDISVCVGNNGQGAFVQATIPAGLNASPLQQNKINANGVSS